MEFKLEGFAIIATIMSVWATLFTSYVKNRNSRIDSKTKAEIELMKLILEATRMQSENTIAIVELEIELMRLEKETLKELKIIELKSKYEFELSKENNINSLILKIIETPEGIKRLDELNKYFNK